MTNRNDHGFPEIRSQHEIDDLEFSDFGRHPNIRPGAAVIALAVTAAAVACGVLLALAVYVAKGGL